MIPIVILSFFVLFFSSPASADELNVDQCVSLALQNNPIVKAQEMEVLSSEEGTKISRSDFFPALKLQGRDVLLDKDPKFTMRSNSLAAGIPPGDVDVAAGDRNFYGATAMVEQTLFKGGQLTHTLRRSEMLREEAGHSLARQKKLLAFEVKRAFGNALREQYRLRILEKELEFKRERLKILRERRQEGYVSREEVLLMETDLATSEEELANVRSREELSLSRLTRLMGYPPGHEIVLKGEAVKGALRVSLQEVREAALKNRDEMKAALARVSAADEEIGVAKGNYYPKASLQGGYAIQKETAVTRPDVWFLYLQADWSVFEWGKTQAEVRKAGALKQKRIYEQEDLKRAVQLEAEESWRAMKEREREVAVREKRVQTAEVRFKRTMERYKERVVKLVDVLESEAELRKSHQEYLLGLTDLNVALAHLEASASAMPPGWFNAEPPYQPDLESFSRNLNSLLQVKKEESKGEMTVAKSPETAQAPPTHAAPPLAPARVEPAPLPAREEGHVVIQVGTYQVRQNAAAVRDQLAPRVGPREVKIVPRGKGYLVVITGFKDRKEAHDLMRDLGRSDYLVRLEAPGE